MPSACARTRSSSACILTSEQVRGAGVASGIIGRSGGPHMSLLESPVTREAQMFSLDNVSWELYELLLRDVDHQNVRITYDQGRMVLMSPLPRHDKVKTLLGRFIEMASLERDVPISSFGSTTWKRQDVGKGLEAD